jgi:hypothetical protein
MTAVNASAFVIENQDGIRGAASRFCKRWAIWRKLETFEDPEERAATGAADCL